MKKNVTDILDIHTHKQEVDTQGKYIINYPLLADSPLYMPLAENVEVAVGRGSYYSIGIHPWEVRESNVSQQLSFLQQLYRLLRFSTKAMPYPRLLGARFFFHTQQFFHCFHAVNNQRQTELFRQLYLFLKHR